MSKFYAAIPFITFAGIGTAAVFHEMYATGGLCLFAAFLCVGIINRKV